MEITYRVRPQLNQYELAIVIESLKAFHAGAIDNPRYAHKMSALSKMLKAQVSIDVGSVSASISGTGAKLAQATSNKPMTISAEQEAEMMKTIFAGTPGALTKDDL